MQDGTSKLIVCRSIKFINWFKWTGSLLKYSHWPLFWADSIETPPLLHPVPVRFFQYYFLVYAYVFQAISSTDISLLKYRMNLSFLRCVSRILPIISIPSYLIALLSRVTSHFVIVCMNLLHFLTSRYSSSSPNNITVVRLRRVRRRTCSMQGRYKEENKVSVVKGEGKRQIEIPRYKSTMILK